MLQLFSIEATEKVQITKVENMINRSLNPKKTSSYDLIRFAAIKQLIPEPGRPIPKKLHFIVLF